MVDKMSDERLREVYRCYMRLYNKEPSDYNELLEFSEMLSSISKTYDLTCDQIDKDILLKYKNLINA